MDSIIRVNAEREGKKTVLKESYHNAPYKVRHNGTPNTKKHLDMIIMSASPGIMDGDSLSIDVHVRKDAELKLVTQSYNKLHPMKRGASQHTTVNLDTGSLFHYVPHPITPFKDSIFKTVNDIRIGSGATLIFGDIIAAGRIFMNESFEFSKLHTITNLYSEGRLIYKDNQCLLPKEQPLKEMLFFEGHTHQATFIYSGPFADAMKTEMDEILTVDYEDVEYGFTQCAENTILLRAVADNGDLLYNFLVMLGQMCWVFTQGRVVPNKEEEGLQVTLPAVEETPAKKTVRKEPAAKTPPKTRVKNKTVRKGKKTAKAVESEVVKKKAV